MQLTQKLGAYANVQANSCPFDGRNCTADEVFPRLVLRPLPQRRFRNRGDSLNALWKSRHDSVSRKVISKGNDSRLLCATQFVCHTSPANLACDERVRKIYKVKERNESG